MFALIKGAFLQRRKTLVNALAGYPPAKTDKESVAAALKELGLEPLVRGETLGLAEFAALAERLQA